MHKPTTQQLEACARLQAQEQHFIALLEERLRDSQRAMSHLANEVEVRWAQGRAQELESLLALHRDAAKQLSKHQQYGSR